MSEPTTIPRNVSVADTTAGNFTIEPPTFLERWGIVLVACAGSWILLVASILLVYFLWKAPAFPQMNPSSEQMRDAANSYRMASEQWRNSLSYMFDLLVTKTVLPIVTLRLGYLFGRSKSLA